MERTLSPWIQPGLNASIHFLFFSEHFEWVFMSSLEESGPMYTEG